jgi:hypothetical protein
MLVNEGAGLAPLGDAPSIDEESESPDSLSGMNDTPDCLMSSSRNNISDCSRLRLYEISHGIRRCSRPFRWK